MLKNWIVQKNNFNTVCMTRVVYDNISYDYTSWKITNENILFFDSTMRIAHILDMINNITTVDDNKIIVHGQNPKYEMSLEIFFGGASN